MLDETELYPIANQYQPQTWLVGLFFSLLGLPAGARILVIEHTVTISEFAQSLGYDVVRIDSWKGLTQQLHDISSIGQVDGVIITPVFSSAVVEPELPPQGWPNLGKTAGEDWLLAFASSHLSPTGSLVALVPNGLLTNHRRLPVRRGLVQFGLAAVVSLPARDLFVDMQTIVLTSIVLLRRDNSDPDREMIFIDLSESGNIATEASNISLESIPSSGNAVAVVASALNENMRLDPRYYDPKYLQIKPPEGYVEVSLGEICEIMGGVSIDKEHRYDMRPSEQFIPYLQVRHILSNAQIAEQVYWVDPEKVLHGKSRIAKPGDILVTSAGTIGRLAVVPSIFDNGVLFDTSLRLLRVNVDYVESSSVAEFLQSEMGQLQLRRLTSGSAIPVLTTPALASVSIYLSVSGPNDGPRPDSTTDIPTNSTQAIALADAIEEKVLRYLRLVGPTDTDWPQKAAELLEQLTADLVPKKLVDLVLQNFPTPIAIPYRRYLMAKHNPYERLERMVSLVESCVFFVFGVLLADHCHQPVAKRVDLSKLAKNAKKGDDIYANKLKFIFEHVAAAQEGSCDLYMSELARSTVFEVGDKFRSEVRNVIAHSAPGSESYVTALVARYENHVNELLDSLRFFAEYTLCRIRGHYYRNGQWYYQAEIYRGAEYDSNIQEDTLTVFSGEDGEDVQLLRADREHLVLLSANGEILDLHPFYQMHFGEETCRESQLCFFKSYKNGELIGESVRNSLEVRLRGVDDFMRLISE